MKVETTEEHFNCWGKGQLAPVDGELEKMQLLRKMGKS